MNETVNSKDLLTAAIVVILAAAGLIWFLAGRSHAAPTVWVTGSEARTRLERTGWGAVNHDALECLGSGEEQDGRYQYFVCQTVWSGKWRAFIHTTRTGATVITATHPDINR